MQFPLIYAKLVLEIIVRKETEITSKNSAANYHEK